MIEKTAIRSWFRQAMNSLSPSAKKWVTRAGVGTGIAGGGYAAYNYGVPLLGQKMVNSTLSSPETKTALSDLVNSTLSSSKTKGSIDSLINQGTSSLFSGSNLAKMLGVGTVLGLPSLLMNKMNNSSSPKPTQESKPDYSRYLSFRANHGQ